MTAKSSLISLGARLRAARLAAGMSQTALTEKSGIPKPTLSRYENDHVSPSLHTLKRLAIALDVPEASLLGGKTSLFDVFMQAVRAEDVTFISVTDAQHAGTDVGKMLHRKHEAREQPQRDAG